MAPPSAAALYLMRKIDIKFAFVTLCTVILLLVMTYSTSLFSGRRSASHQSGRHQVSYLWEESEAVLDVHLEGPERGHETAAAGRDSSLGRDSVVSHHQHHAHHKSNQTSIAIGLAITARDQEFLTLENVPYRTPFLKSLLPSFCNTVSPGYAYHFYVAFDMQDPYLSQESFLRAIHSRFQEVVQQLCPGHSSYLLHFIQCKHNRSPSWAQNDAMMEAYLDGRDFYYRVNDDTQMMSPGWTETFIASLQNFSPPNVGVVGPIHKGGNEVILTYDFVHKTHIDIFGYYYPRLFTDWWADNWMTEVYGERRTLKLAGVRVMHTLEAGTRYKVHFDIGQLLKYQIAEDRATLHRFLNPRSIQPAKADDTQKVISMSLWGKDPRYTFGALRNAQLVPVFFSGWTLRVYVEKASSSGATEHPAVPDRILDKLQELGAHIFYVNSQQSHIPPMMWRFLVADDLEVDYFIVRDADGRLSDRDALVVEDWIESGQPFHCVRDHPSHAQFALLGGLWGAKPRKLRLYVTIPWQDLMMGYRSDYVMDMAFLANAVWPKVQKHAYCHDSVSCRSWPGAQPFPVARVRTEHLGQVFDAFGNARDDDVRILMERAAVPECVTNKYNVSVAGGALQGKGAFMGLTFEGQDKTAHDAAEPLDMKDAPPPHHIIAQVGDVVRAMAPQHKSAAAPANSSSSLVVWTVDFHSGATRALKSLLQHTLRVNFLDQSLSSKCHFAQSCASNLRVLTKNNAMELHSSTIDLFYKEYENDPEMNLVTHFLCTYPVSLCELYLKFRKPIIVYATHRYEMGRYGMEKWELWNSHLVNMSQNAENTIAASSKYDAAYMEYFTGVRPEVIPLYCRYVNAHYKPTQPSVLVAPLHNPTFQEFLFTEIDRESRQNSNVTRTIASLSDLYPHYTFQDIASHTALIHIPYQASTVSFCEHYHINIPIFVPTVELLIDWHLKYNLLSELTFNKLRSLLGVPEAPRPRQQQQQGRSGVGVPDPNQNQDRDSLQHWLRLADFYQQQAIVYFSSIPDLLLKLQVTNLETVSGQMRQVNKVTQQEVIDKWKRVFGGLS